jgi:DNA-binding response OmpR family regulator
MIAIHIIDADATARRAARRVLEAAGFAVSEAAEDSCGNFRGLIIADIATVTLAALRRRHPAARLLAVGADLAGEGLRKPFTPSQLLVAVRLCLARGPTDIPGVGA